MEVGSFDDWEEISYKELHEKVGDLTLGMTNLSLTHDPLQHQSPIVVETDKLMHAVISWFGTSQFESARQSMIEFFGTLPPRYDSRYFMGKLSTQLVMLFHAHRHSHEMMTHVLQLCTRFINGTYGTDFSFTCPWAVKDILCLDFEERSNLDAALGEHIMAWIKLESCTPNGVESNEYFLETLVHLLKRYYSSGRFMHYTFALDIFKRCIECKVLNSFLLSEINVQLGDSTYSLACAFGICATKDKHLNELTRDRLFGDGLKLDREAVEELLRCMDLYAVVHM